MLNIIDLAGSEKRVDSMYNNIESKVDVKA